ncbi:MAG TPA: M23 family metallopeptidase [Jiangellaceae bacterium]|nr:M23 family metallopeptidase [Jiangellaceae bacterium]
MSPTDRIRMPSPTMRARVACTLVLAAAGTSITTSPSSAAAVDPTALSAATDAAAAAKSALADATTSAEKAQAAVTEADKAVRTAQSALAAARSRATHLSERVADVTAQRLITEKDGGLLEVADTAAGVATGDTDSALAAAAGTAVTTGLAAVVGPLVGALDLLSDVVDDQVAAADDEVETAVDREQRIRQERAAAVRDHRAAAVTVTEAEGLFDAAEAAYMAAEDVRRGADSRSVTASAAAAEFTASLGIDRRLVRPGLGPVSSPYGMRSHPVTGVHKPHTGIDFSPADGLAYATADGTVAAVTVEPAYGNLVTIAHGNGITTRYAHLAAASVRPGDRITGGDVIGRIGSTGLSTGPHLHFEILVDGEFHDPAPWLAR